MSFIKNIFTPNENYNYKIIFITYLILSVAMVCLFFTAYIWEDIKGFWIVLSPYVFGLPYYAYMWKQQTSIKEKRD